MTGTHDELVGRVVELGAEGEHAPLEVVELVAAGLASGPSGGDKRVRRRVLLHGRAASGGRVVEVLRGRERPLAGRREFESRPLVFRALGAARATALRLLLALGGRRALRTRTAVFFAEM